MSKLTKVTEIVGRHECGFDGDGVRPAHQPEHLASFESMLPDGADGKRGRWRITVEFEPEEET